MDPDDKAGTTFEGEDLELKDQNNEKTAIGNFFSTLHGFMTDDYYSLKTDDKKDPRYREQYDMESYRKHFQRKLWIMLRRIDWIKICITSWTQTS